MKLRWKLLKVMIAVGLLVAALAGGQGAATVSAHGKAKHSAPTPTSTGPGGQPFIITF